MIAVSDEFIFIQFKLYNCCPQQAVPFYCHLIGNIAVQNRQCIFINVQLVMLYISHKLACLLQLLFVFCSPIYIIVFVFQLSLISIQWNFNNFGSLQFGGLITHCFGRQIYLSTKVRRRLLFDVTVILFGYVTVSLRSTKAFLFLLFQRRVL